MSISCANKLLAFEKQPAFTITSQMMWLYEKTASQRQLTIRDASTLSRLKTFACVYCHREWRHTRFASEEPSTFRSSNRPHFPPSGFCFRDAHTLGEQNCLVMFMLTERHEDICLDWPGEVTSEKTCFNTILLSHQIDTSLVGSVRLHMRKSPAVAPLSPGSFDRQAHTDYNSGSYRARGHFGD